MTDFSDGALLEAHRRGDASAFAALVGRHEAALLQHARALLGRGSAYEDAVQEAFLRLAQTPPLLPDEIRGDERAERAHLGAWLHTVVRNLCLDTLRAESRRKKRERGAAVDEANTDGGFEMVDAQDTKEAVRRELEQLHPDQREVLVLRLVGERSYKEIAEITGKKIGTVGWLISVGLQELGERLRPRLAPQTARSTGAAASSGLGSVTGGVS